jgi:GntR family transcriptional regulator, transcriptional repressor for pyruvate dehydrogenase complex
MSEAAWHPVARSRAYELVVEQVEEQILAGALKVGDRLPGERALAAQLEVSRAAVREAIRTLEAQGVVRSAVGSGPEAGTVVSAVPAEALNRLLRLHVALANFPMADVIEARVMLERFSATLAAGHATAEDTALMGELLAEMDADGISRERFNDLDTEFHIAIAEAGGNRLVADMTVAIRDSTRRPILRGLEALGAGWTEVCAGLRAEHHLLHTAIAEGRGAAAADAVEAHIRSTGHWLLPASR